MVPANRVEDADDRTARSWREAKTPRAAWQAFRRWLLRTRPHDDGDAPYWQDEHPTTYSSHHQWTGATATRLVLFQKLHVMNEFLPDGRGGDRASRWRIATATAPFAPRPLDVELIRAHARLIGGKIGFVGDLDPHGLHVFGSLRSGDLERPDIHGRRLVIDWMGIDGAWLARTPRTSRSLLGRTITMKWIEREYWDIVKRFMPDVRALIGEESFALLERGSKVELEGFADILPTMLRLRLRRGGRG